MLGAVAIVLDIMGRHPGPLVIAGSILISASLIAWAIRTQ
jgi:hypothetical protein